jgi:hypothetical protein
VPAAGYVDARPDRRRRVDHPLAAENRDVVRSSSVDWSPCEIPAGEPPPRAQPALSGRGRHGRGRW